MVNLCFVASMTHALELPVYATDVSVWKNRSGAAANGTGDGGLLNAIDPMKSASSALPLNMPDPLNPAGWKVNQAWQADFQGAPDAVGPYKPLTGNAWITFDLGSVRSGLSKMFIWNVSEATAPNRGIQKYKLHYAASPTVAIPNSAKSGTLSTSIAAEYNFGSGGWTQIGSTNTLDQGDGQGTSPAGTYGYDAAIDMSSVPSARYIGIEILSNYGETGASNTGYKAGLNLAVFTEAFTAMSWLGGVGNWGDGAKWNTGLVTNLYTEIDVTGSVVTVNADASAPAVFVGMKNGSNSLVIASGSTLTVTNVSAPGIAVGTNGFLTVAGTLKAADLSNAGTVTIASTADMSGVNAVSLYGGTLKVVGDNLLGSGTLTLAGGKISSDGTTARTIANPVSVKTDTTLGNAVNNGKLIFSGTTTLLATKTLTLASDAQFDGNISGAFGITKAGTGTLTLNGAKTYNGTTTISAGTVAAVGTNALGVGTIVNAGTLVFKQDSGFTVANTWATPGRTITGYYVVDRVTPGAANDWTFTKQMIQDQNDVMNWQAGTNMTSGTPTVTLSGGLYSSDSNDSAINIVPSNVILRVNGFSGTRSRTYVLAGTSTNNEMYGAVNDNGGGYVSGITKSGTGTWKLSASNNYTRDTTVTAGTLFGVTGGSCNKSSFIVTNTLGSTAALGVSVTNSTLQWSCTNLTLNTSDGGAQIKFEFSVTPSLSQPPLRILNTLTFNGTPRVVIDPANINAGKIYPLLVADVSAPTGLPTLSGVKGYLSWGGTGSRTLYLNTPASGSVILFR
jgi:autotransporter-associated beta strand protein